ncbi:MAG: hypothetical protein HQK49_10785 [Oligoflexia bacterium]|nr:hypothetical protein [Oligoflexia bacterium]
MKIIFNSLTAFYGDGTALMELITAFIYSIFNLELAIELAFGAFSLIGYYYIINLGKIRSTNGILLLLYFPSTFFWFSTISKDLIIFVVICGYLYHTYQIVILLNKSCFKNILFNMSFILLWIMLGYAIRPWIIYILICSTFLWVLLILLINSTHIYKKIIGTFSLVLMSLLLLLKYESFTNLLMSNSSSSAKFFTGGSALALFKLQDPVDYLILGPFYSAMTLFEPFIHQINRSTGITYDFAIISNLLLFLIILAGIVFYIKNKTTTISSDNNKDNYYNVSYYLFIFVSIYLLAYLPFLRSNLGTAFRFKSVITPLILCIVIRVFEKHSREQRNLNLHE